jgi:hypothetical protein
MLVVLGLLFLCVIFWILLWRRNRYPILRGKNLDAIVNNWGLARMLGESDADLRRRARERVARPRYQRCLPCGFQDRSKEEPPCKLCYKDEPNRFVGRLSKDVH